MIARSALTAWIVAASLVASSGARKLSERVAQAMADEAIAAADGNDAVALSLSSIEVSLAWFEGGNELSPHGSNDHGQSACWAQIYLPNGARTLEGWTASELRSDPQKCAHVAVRLIRASISASPTCDGCALTIYARGRDTAEGRRLSRVRMALARRLLAEVTP